RCGGDREEERAAVSGRALHPDATAVGLDDTLGDGKPEPRAAPLRLASLPEPLEQMWQMVLGDPRAGIRDPEPDSAIARFRSDRDAAAGTRELDRVADEILKNLEESVAVAPDFRKLPRHVDAKLERGGGGKALLGFHGLRDQLDWGQPGQLDEELAGLHARHVEQVLDETVHPLRGTLDRVRGPRR